MIINVNNIYNLIYMDYVFYTVTLQTRTVSWCSSLRNLSVLLFMQKCTEIYNVHDKSMLKMYRKLANIILSEQLEAKEYNRDLFPKKDITSRTQIILEVYKHHLDIHTQGTFHFSVLLTRCTTLETNPEKKNIMSLKVLIKLTMFNMFYILNIPQRCCTRCKHTSRLSNHLSSFFVANVRIRSDLNVNAHYTNSKQIQTSSNVLMQISVSLS